MQIDPYHQWLGIPPQEQPPNHYRLLGLAIFESNPKVIESAADRQMAHVRTFQLSAHAALSQKILGEIAAARLVLLTPQRKAEYDERLMHELPMPNPLGGLTPLAASPVTQMFDLADASLLPVGSTPSTPLVEEPKPITPAPVKSLTRSRPAPSKARTIMQIVQMVFGGVAGISIAILALWLFFRKDPFGLFAPVPPAGGPVAAAPSDPGASLPQDSSTPQSMPQRFPIGVAPPTASFIPQGNTVPQASPGAMVRTESSGSPAMTGSSTAPRRVPTLPSSPSTADVPTNPSGVQPSVVDPTISRPTLVPSNAKNPVPTGEALLQARSVVRDLYRGKYDATAALDPVAKSQALEKLAREMSQTAREETDLAAKYACLEFAIRVGAMSGEADILTDPFTQVVRTYDVDETSLRLDAYTRLAKTLAEQLTQALKDNRYERFAIRADESALNAENSGKASEAIQILQLLSPTLLDEVSPAMRTRIESRLVTLGKKGQFSEAARALAAKVEAAPTDLGLKTEYGILLCFELEEWAAGIPQLFAGADPVLRELARKELEASTSPEQQEQLADSWWDYSLQGSHVEPAQRRAAHWYRLMKRHARGLGKLKIEERLGVVASVEGTNRPKALPRTPTDSNLPRPPAPPTRAARPGEKLIEVQLDLRKDSSLTPLSVPETTSSEDVMIEVLAVDSPVETRFKAERATARLGTPVIIEFTDANNVWIELTATRNKRDEVSLRATPKCRFMNNQELSFTLNYLEERSGDIDRTIQTARNSAERAQRLASNSQQLARSAPNPVQRRNAEVTYQQQAKAYASQKQRLDQLLEMKQALPAALEYAKKLHEAVKLTVGVTVTTAANEGGSAGDAAEKSEAGASSDSAR